MAGLLSPTSSLACRAARTCERHQLGINVGQERAIEDALELGARKLARWTQDGTLIAPQQLAKAWGQGLQTIQAAVRCGDLFEVWVNEVPYVAAICVDLGIEQTAKICQALGREKPSTKLMFLKRAHGGLGGKTVVQALQSGIPMSDIEELAAAIDD